MPFDGPSHPQTGPGKPSLDSVRHPSFIETYLPFYEDGDVVERYEYSPYGPRIAWADTVPPAIEQLRFADGALVLEFSEPIYLAIVEQAVLGLRYPIVNPYKIEIEGLLIEGSLIGAELSGTAWAVDELSPVRSDPSGP